MEKRLWDSPWELPPRQSIDRQGLLRPSDLEPVELLNVPHGERAVAVSSKQGQRGGALLAVSCQRNVRHAQEEKHSR